MPAPSLRFAVQVVALLIAYDGAYDGFAQAPSWRDGTLEQLPPPLMGSWQEDRRRQQERDRAQVESMREFRQSESTWVWTETNVGDPGRPLILFRGTPSARSPNR
jgi:hypothetical protein